MASILNQGVGGTQGGQLDPNTGMMQTQPVGPTYNDLLKAGLTYGSQPGTSSQRLGAAMPYSSQSIQPLQPQQMMQTAQERNASQQQDDSLSKIVSMLLSMFVGV